MILGGLIGLQGFGGLVSKSCWMQIDWRSSMGVRTVVKSPEIPREAPVIAAALERGIDVVVGALA